MNFDLENTSWNDLVQTYRKACLQWHKGNYENSKNILGGPVREKVERWVNAPSQNSRQDKKATLEKMFKEEEAKIRDAMTIFSVIEDEIKECLIPEIKRQITAEIEKRLPKVTNNRRVGEILGNDVVAQTDKVPIDDIVGMIDHVLEASTIRQSSVANIRFPEAKVA